MPTYDIYVIKISMVFLRPLNPILQSHWDHRNRSRGLIETAGTNPAVSFKPRLQTLQTIMPANMNFFWSFHLWIRGLNGTTETDYCLIETTESDPVVSLKPHTVKCARRQVTFYSQNDKYASQLSCDASSEAYL
jgi:hypothetical protein